MKFFKILFCTFALFLLASRPVFAYLDPGTGSYIFQILIASAVGGLFFIKSTWRVSKERFQKLIENYRKRNNGDVAG